MISDDEYNSDEIIDDEIITSEEENDDEVLSEVDGLIDSQQENINKTNKQNAEALKKQIALWDSFLELRIKLQQATITSNCFPTTMNTDDEEIRELMGESSLLIRKTLALLLAMEKTRSKKRRSDEFDEEETNSEKKQAETDDHQTTNDLFKKISKKFKHNENTIDEEIDKSYDDFCPERDRIVEKWHERTRGFVKQNKTIQSEQSPIVQIKEIMSFPERLIKRSQTVRIDYDLVCPPSSPTNNENETNSNIFDDGDFYHQLLREFIERKTASITDPDQINMHYAQLRKLRNKLKKNVDTRASKDRKIRYNVHKKLVNYMAPIDRCSFTDEAKSDLFSSLFGATPTGNIDAEPSSPVNDIRII